VSTNVNQDLVQDLARQVRALGANFDPAVAAATRAIYRPFLDLSPAGEERIDLAYGPHARHRLDVYLPSTAPRAVVVFVHGGGYVAGDKNGDGAFYVNLGRWLARNGYAGVLPNYRLAPADPWPAGAVDVQAVMRWVNENRATLGVATAPVVAWGQSAGASHVASWYFDDAARGEAAAPVDALLLMSGFYAPEAPLPPGPRAYFGDDAALYPLRAPVSHVKATSAQVLLAVAEFDPGWIAQHTYALARALTLANGQGPQFHYFRDHNHVSTVQSLGTPQGDAGAEVLRFLNTLALKGRP
jgi:triacylglycerol lipase